MFLVPYTPGNFNKQHVLLQWGGPLPGLEEWSCSLRFCEQSSAGGLEVPPQAEVKSWLEGSVQEAVLAYHTRSSTRIHTNAKLAYAKLNRIDVEGHYMDSTTNEVIFADISGGNSDTGSQSLPNQCALAVSLTTGFSRGPAHRGRFYLPLPSVYMEDGSGAIVPNHVADIVASTKTFLEALADVPGLDSPVSLTPSVMSRKAGAAANRPITGVEIGRIIDTQRRRRRSLSEAPTGKVALDLGAS